MMELHSDASLPGPSSLRVRQMLTFSARLCTHICPQTLLGAGSFPGLNHLRVVRLVHGHPRKISVYSRDGAPHMPFPL